MFYKSQHTRTTPDRPLLDPCRELLDMAANLQIPADGEQMRRAILQQSHNLHKAVEVVQTALRKMKE